jgi:hypothetical protein
VDIYEGWYAQAGCPIASALFFLAISAFCPDSDLTSHLLSHGTFM